MDARKSRFAPNTPDPLCAKGTRHLIRFARNGSIQRSLTLDHRRTRRGGGGGAAAHPGLEKFQGKLCFQGNRKFLKNPE